MSHQMNTQLNTSILYNEVNESYNPAENLIHTTESLEKELDYIENKQNSVFEMDSASYREIAPFFCKLPGDSCDSPRDYLNINNTRDVIFIALILYRLEGKKNVLELMDDKGIYHYIVEDSTESYKYISKIPGLAKKITRYEVKNIFKARFYDYRYALSTYKNNTIECRFESERLKSFGNLGGLKLWKFGKSLKHPFYVGNDPLLDGILNINFFEWLNKATRECKKGEAFCPLDGPVKPLTGKLRMFKKNIMNVEWKVDICPHCIGAFNEVVSKVERIPLQWI